MDINLQYYIQIADDRTQQLLHPTQQRECNIHLFFIPTHRKNILQRRLRVCFGCSTFGIRFSATKKSKPLDSHHHHQLILSSDNGDHI
jgi:hypothetical protein